MGLDVGKKRIGVALSDELGLTAQPLTMVERGPGPAGLTRAIGQLAEMAERYRAVEVVVGLPKNMDGSLGAGARAVMDFARQLEKRLDCPVNFIDERLTSAAAERMLLEADLSRRKRKEHKDKIAAAIILQSRLDAGEFIEGE